MIKLNVPFQEKDEAKALGARWNPELRSWTIEDDQDPTPFARWLPKPPSYNVKADTYSVVRGHTNCWSCGQVTDAFGIRIDSGSYSVDGGHEQIDGDMLCNIRHLSGDLDDRLKTMTDGRFRQDFSKMADQKYLMNHCKNCGAKIGDYGLHNEPDGPFYCQQSLHVIETIFEDIQADSGVSMFVDTGEEYEA